MIKEKKKSLKYTKKTIKQLLLEYVRTVLFSIAAAVIFVSLLTVHARNEIIKTIDMSATEQHKLDKKTAEILILQKNFLNHLPDKSYSVCMQVGNLYETAGDYEHARTAYEFAVKKSKNGIYTAHYKLASIFILQEKFNEAQAVLDSVKDFNNKNLIKFKTRTYIVMGDKYYSMGKFLSAARSYEKAGFYYDKFRRKDKVIDRSIKNRIINSYVRTADILVKRGMTTDALRFLQKAEKYSPEDFQIRYKIAVILSDLDPEKSVKYFEALFEEKPQNIDNGVYISTLLKAANAADADGKAVESKYYRYKMHSIDMYTNRKVIYKNDIVISLKPFQTKKRCFVYPIECSFNFSNISNSDITTLYADFVLTYNNKVQETISTKIADKNAPLFAGSDETVSSDIKFRKKIFTRKELKNYAIEIYIYKDSRFKTPAARVKVVQDTPDVPDEAK